MRKCLIMPDSFKGTMNSLQVCEIMEKTLSESLCDSIIECYPIADGGEGTIACFAAAMDVKIKEVDTVDPYFRPIKGSYGRTGNIAIVELAVAAGLPLVKDKQNPGLTSTYGVGLIIKQAIADGCKQIMIGLGGSCTNDGGAGMAAAMGVKFLDAKGEEFIPDGVSLSKICGIDTRQCSETLEGVSITAMCDIKNTLCGSDGAANVFAAQKGADARQIEELEYNMVAYAAVIQNYLGINVLGITGGGAAGGAGAGACAFFGAQLKSGIEVVLDMIEFERITEDCDILITGEGKLDGQSLGGKVVSGITQRAAQYNLPVAIVAGDVDETVCAEDFSTKVRIYKTKPAWRTQEQIKEFCCEDLHNTMLAVARDIEHGILGK